MDSYRFCSVFHPRKSPAVSDEGWVSSRRHQSAAVSRRPSAVVGQPSPVV